MNVKTVLLIEDNADDIELTHRAFEKLGIVDQVHIARDGEKALDYLLSRGAYADQKTLSGLCLVLLDLNLPKTSGLDVLRQIRTHDLTRHLPVVILTVSRKEPDLLQSFTMGISDYLIKPLDPDRFTQIYRKYVRTGTL
jgi:two-component system response regulator